MTRLTYFYKTQSSIYLSYTELSVHPGWKSYIHLGEPSFQQTVDEAAVLTGITCIPDEHNINQWHAEHIYELSRKILK